MKEKSGRSKYVWLVAVLAVVAAVVYFAYWRPQEGEKTPGPVYWPTQGWQSSLPEEEGMDSAKLADALLAIQANDIDIHSLLIIRDGRILLDAYFYPYDGTVPHDLASVTKSFTTTLVAIAADQGKLQLDQPLLSLFPGRPIANRDALKEKVTVRQLTSMSSGFECMGFEQDEGTLNAMYASPDWVQFALDRPMVREPGTQFVYDSPGMHLLSASLQQATGMTEAEFARQNLFEPLGIKDVIWPADPQGFTDGWGDLHLQPRDAAKLGYLWLNHGVWDGKQIVSREWVDSSGQTQIKTGLEDDYGYGWWVLSGDFGNQYEARGRGGQLVSVLPQLNLILVATGAGYDMDKVTPLLVPALVSDKALPANPAGVEKLNAALAQIVKAPAPQPVAPLPALARSISGQTYVLDPNPAGLKSVRLDFDGSSQAVLQLAYDDNRPSPPQPVGLDGVYRLSPGEYDLPQGWRGSWTDENTLMLEGDRIANFERIDLEVTFPADQILIKARFADHELGMTFTGRAQ